MKRGSALLVVLGMVAFMIISAVAFSAYMRTSRMPSSFLVRTSSSRFLAKAALAEAIDQIDIAIGNDPYPGMGDKGESYWYPRTTATDSSSLQTRRNYWRKNCFIGSNRFETAENTISTLTLEGLAYLPPCMINEARYYSRHARTARWQQLPFDAGRYAFTAYDVSNYFDINRVAANVGRNSSDNGRISISYLFENQAHTGDGTVTPQAWDEFMKNFVDTAKAADDGYAGRLAPYADKGYLPLVSLADFSLVANDKLPSLVNPFCDFIESGNDFVSSTGGTQGNDLRLQMFVTDSWFPKTNVTNTANAPYDLTSSEYQPFERSDLATRDVRLWPVMSYTSKGTTRLLQGMGGSQRWLCGIGLCALWDYLDEDSVPLSLAIPTVERTPMVCGIEIKTGQGQLKLVEEKKAPGGGLEDDTTSNAKNPVTVVSYNDGKTKADSLSRTVRQLKTYTLDTQTFGAFFNGLDVNALAVYPFRRLENENNYKIGGRLAFYFVEGGETFHTENADDVLHMSVQKDLTQPSFDTARGVFYVPLKEKTMTLPSSSVEKEEDVVKGYNLDADGTQAAQTFSATMVQSPMFTITTTWTQTREYNSESGQYTAWTDAAEPTVEAAQCNLPPLKNDYTPDERYTQANNFKNLVTGGGGESVRLQLSAWVYIKESGSGKYVDLVPACVRDDDDLNSTDNYGDMGPDANAFGVPYALMNLYGNSFEYAPKTMTEAGQPLMTGKDFGISTACLFCPDPRWNWAPEHWIKVANATMDAQTWLSTYSKRGEGGRDRDIFMETSDACYLQSVYELAFLPRLTDWPTLGTGENPTCRNQIYGNMTAIDGLGQTDFKTSFDDLPNNGLMWRTYRPFDVNGQSADDFEAVGFTSEGTGFRVSPYAPVDTLMAAFANTPFGWAVASTNQQSGAKISASKRKASTFNRDYCFNEMASEQDTKFAWNDLKSIAQSFHDKVRALNKSQLEDGGAWDGWKLDAFDDIDWAGTSFANGSDTFAGVSLSDNTCVLSDADKKFLYGYWRDCFAAKQQLFLVFVRAEPTMLGGGTAKGVPPSLGARAVALVWRDPTPTIEDAASQQPRPHRTRVLFYRQFE
jgi:hypothetical protein